MDDSKDENDRETKKTKIHVSTYDYDFHPVLLQFPLFWKTENANNIEIFPVGLWNLEPGELSGLMEMGRQELG